MFNGSSIETGQGLEFELITLSNGIRVAFRESFHTQIAHAGIFINAGSRDEFENEVGIAHLLEHMLFKGTHKRNSHQVINRLEVVGGDLNAFTTKDKTVVHASVVKEHFERAIELLADVTFNSSFPEKELAKEKKVIYEEIDMYFDSPDEQIFDDFQEHLYKNHPLGNNILGSRSSIENLHSEDLRKFVRHAYYANEIIVSVVAPISLKRVEKICRKYFESIVLPTGQINRVVPQISSTFDLLVEKQLSQAHALIGGNAFPLNHDKRPVTMLLTNLLGGPGMNSILNLDLREKRAYTYGVDCSYQALTDSGFFTIYWSTEDKNMKKSRKVILGLMDKLANDKLSETQLKKYKTQFQGQLIMAEESNSSMMFVIGRSLLDLGYVDSLNDILSRVQQITPEEIRDVAQELFKAENLSFLTYQPTDN
ncbi:MAG: insulinase family protein [Bacteroidetes bacterium]|nr:insulinase family protein [Bacteroidota bacterium]